MLSLQGNLPAWAAITEAHFQDMKILDELPLAPGAYYVMDRGYLDFTRLRRLDRGGSFFVVRNKRHVKFRVLASRPIDKISSGLRCDQKIQLTTSWSTKWYPQPLRRIRVYDAQNQITLVLLTNQFALPSVGDRPAVSETLAGGTVLQMDQTTSADSQFLWPQSQCGALPNLVGDLRLPDGGDCEEAVQNPEKFE